MQRESRLSLGPSFCPSVGSSFCRNNRGSGEASGKLARVVGVVWGLGWKLSPGPSHGSSGGQAKECQ